MKEFVLPVALISNTKQTLKYEAIPLVNLSLDSIIFEGESKTIKRLNLFYEKTADVFFKFAKETFFEFALSDYEADDSPRKKYRYIPFDLVFQITYETKKNNIICIDQKISVSKKRKILAEKSISHIWLMGKRTIILKKK